MLPCKAAVDATVLLAFEEPRHVHIRAKNLPVLYVELSTAMWSPDVVILNVEFAAIGSAPNPIFPDPVRARFLRAKYESIFGDIVTGPHIDQFNRKRHLASRHDH